MDVVVTVPQQVWLNWLAEGDLPGEQATGEWGFFTGPGVPKIEPGERVYVVAWGFLRGYAPLVEARRRGRGVCLVRQGGATPVTLIDRERQPVPMQGFRGWRYRDWNHDEEAPFDAWQTHGLPPRLARDVEALQMLRARGPDARAELSQRALRGAPLFAAGTARRTA